MSNLLLEPERRKLRNEYRARFILAGSFLAIAMAFFTLLTLSPSYGVLYVTRPAAVAEASFVQQSKADSAEIAKAQTLVTQLKPVAAASSSVSSTLESVLSKRPNGIRIDAISYIAAISSSIPANLSISGVVDNRAAMSTFRTKLQEDDRFSTIKLPVGDLINANGSEFTITALGRF